MLVCRSMKDGLDVMLFEDLAHTHRIGDIGNAISLFDLGSGSGMLQVEERGFGLVDANQFRRTITQ